MYYMGNKNRLVEKFLIPTMRDFMGRRKPRIFSDLFLGTGSVAKAIKDKYHCKIIGSDLQLYSVIINKHFIVNNSYFDFVGLEKEFTELRKIEDKESKISYVCNYLNDLKGVPGFIFNSFCPGGKDKRQYFTDDNGKRADAIRLKIREWNDKELLTVYENNFLLGCLIEAIDKVANTTSVYGAYLKQIKKAAAKNMDFKSIGIIENKQENKIFQENANIIAKDENLEHDVVYIDPPYNSRQYASNYHVLETIAEYDETITLTGKTGMRNYDSQKSKYSQKGEAYNALKDLVDNIDANYIFVSYTSEGILSPEEIQEILSRRGRYDLKKYGYKRYKSDKEHENRKYRDDDLHEHLHCLKIER